MGEIINVIVAISVIYLVVRWATSSSESPEDRNIRIALGFRPKKVTPEMVDTISTMFPDMPRSNIHYDLLRTGDVEATTNKVIERGFLDVPPTGYFRVYPRTNDPLTRVASPNSVSNGAASTSSYSSGARSKQAPSLIERFKLEDRIASPGTEDGLLAKSPEEAGGKATWETTAKQREASLRERKAQMILAARRRLIEQQKSTISNPTPATSS